MKGSVFPSRGRRSSRRVFCSETIQELEKKIQDQSYIEGAIQRLALILSKRLLSMRGIECD